MCSHMMKESGRIGARNRIDTSRKKQLFSMIFGPKNKSIFWFKFRRQRRVTHSCSSLHQSDPQIRKIVPKIMVVRIDSAQRRGCLHGNQDTWHPAHVGTNLQKDATRRPCQHTTIAAANCSRIGLPSGPLGLGGHARAGHPETYNRTPRPSKIGPHRTRKPKIREQFSVPFSGPFSGP